MTRKAQAGLTCMYRVQTCSIMIRHYSIFVVPSRICSSSLCSKGLNASSECVFPLPHPSVFSAHPWLCQQSCSNLIRVPSTDGAIRLSKSIMRPCSLWLKANSNAPCFSQERKSSTESTLESECSVRFLYRLSQSECITGV